MAFGFVFDSWPLEAFSRCAFGGSAASDLDLGASSMSSGTLMAARAIIFANCTTKFDISVFSFSVSVAITSAAAFHTWTKKEYGGIARTTFCSFVKTTSGGFSLVGFLVRVSS